MADNLAKKIAKLRNMIGVTKDGQNKFSGYSYFQITDIYNASKKPFMDEGVFTAVRQTMEFHDGEPYYTFFLDVYNVDNIEDMFTYSMITKHNNLKGASEGQNSGGNNTYSLKTLMSNLLMLDDNSEDPDRKNDHKTTVVKPKSNEGVKILTITELRKRFVGLEKSKLLDYMSQYSKSEGIECKNPKFVKKYFLEIVREKEGWK